MRFFSFLHFEQMIAINFNLWKTKKKYFYSRVVRPALLP